MNIKLMFAAALAWSSLAGAETFVSPLAPEAVNATGSGYVTLVYDASAHTLAINANFSGLSGNTTMAHVHCCVMIPREGTAGVAVATSGNLPGFPVGVTSATYTRVLDLSLTTSYASGFLAASGGTAAGAEARVIDSLNAGVAYFNVHTSTFGGGEIRGFPDRVFHGDGFE